MSQIINCRTCTSLNENLIPLDDELRDCFESITQMKLFKIENISDSICSLCCKNLKYAFDYRNDLIKQQQKIFQNYFGTKINSEFYGDPINLIPTTSNDLNTVLFIKQEPEADLGRNSFVFAEEQWDENSTSSDESERGTNKRKIKKYNYYQKKKKAKGCVNGVIPCEVCKKPIKKYYYKEHLLRVHMTGKNLTCDICNHQSYYKAALEVHMTKHFNIKPFECTFCDEKFRSKKDLKIHVQNSHPDAANSTELFICETCGKSFKLKKLMDNHVRSNHTNERPFMCQEPGCTAAYFCNTNLATHKRRAHSQESVTCDVCGKSFRSLINLKEHVRKNHKEGQHICPAEGCNRRFITPYYLNLHAKTHYGIRDRECEWCGQRFFNKKHLNQHVEVAHKKSRFYCQVPGCSSVFSRKCNIREHVKKIHRELSEETKQKLLSDITKMKPIYMANAEESRKGEKIILNV